MNEKIEELLEMLREIQIVMEDWEDDSFHTALIYAQQLEEELQALSEE